MDIAQSISPKNLHLSLYWHGHYFQQLIVTMLRKVFWYLSANQKFVIYTDNLTIQNSFTTDFHENLEQHINNVIQQNYLFNKTVNKTEKTLCSFRKVRNLEHTTIKMYWKYNMCCSDIFYYCFMKQEEDLLIDLNFKRNFYPFQASKIVSTSKMWLVLSHWGICDLQW